MQLYTAGHPLDGNVRRGTKGPEFAKPITIGSDCWFGGGVIVIGGITIGDGGVQSRAHGPITTNQRSFVRLVLDSMRHRITGFACPTSSGGGSGSCRHEGCGGPCGGGRESCTCYQEAGGPSASRSRGICIAVK